MKRDKRVHRPETRKLPDAGFTLLEALVAVGIILAMAIAGFSRIADAKKSERDAIRRADLSEIRSRLMDYYYENQFAFPETIDEVATDDSPLPTDPLTQSSYIYTVDTDLDGKKNDFSLEAMVESPIDSQPTIRIEVTR